MRLRLTPGDDLTVKFYSHRAGAVVEPGFAALETSAVQAVRVNVKAGDVIEVLDDSAQFLPHRERWADEAALVAPVEETGASAAEEATRSKRAKAG